MYCFRVLRSTLILSLLIFLGACGTDEDPGSRGGGGTSGTGGSSGTGGAPPEGAPVSDDFYGGSLDTQVWQVVDPHGDGTVEVIDGGTSHAQLLLTVPAGTSHNPWEENGALRVMQAAPNEDFELEVRFESSPAQRYQMQGILVEQEAGQYLRFDVHSDGSSTILFLATFGEFSLETPVEQKIASAPEVYLRLARTGDEWNAQYSHDGSTWTSGGTFTFALEVTSVGVFAGNYDPSPAFTAVVDYFFETSSRIDPEDAAPCNPPDRFTVTAATTGTGSLSLRPEKASYACGEVVTLIAQPAVGGSFLGWDGALDGTQNPASLTVEDDISVTANFDVDTTPPHITALSPTPTSTEASLGWLTDELSTGLVEYGETNAYELGSVSSDTANTSHSVVIPGLQAGTTYHYRITAKDKLDNSASTADATFMTVPAGPAGPIIGVWHGLSQTFGKFGQPQRWVNVLGNAQDPQGVSSMGYSLNGGPEQFLSIGSSGQRLQSDGDFNVEIDYDDLNPGINTVSIRAADADGNESNEIVQVERINNPAPASNYTVDWSTVTDFSDVAQVVDGKWLHLPSGLRTIEIGYDRIVSFGDMNWTDYEAEVDITINAPIDQSTNDVGVLIGLIMRWTGHVDWFGGQPRVGWHPFGVLANYMWIDDYRGLGYWESDGPLVHGSGKTPEPEVGVPYTYKIKGTTRPNGDVDYKFKVWRTGDPEPHNWGITYLSDVSLENGSLAVVTHYADITIGGVRVTSLAD